MLLIALITAGLVGNAHTGSAPAVSAPVADAPSVVFDRPAPAAPKPAPAKSIPRPLPPPENKPAKPAAAPPLAHGVPLANGPFVCYQYIVNPALDPKYQTFVNAGISQAACINAPPGAPLEP